MIFNQFKLGEISTIKQKGGTPDKLNAEYWSGDLPWLTSGETSNMFITETKKHISKEAADSKKLEMVPKGSLVIARSGQGSTRGQTSLCLIDTYVNDGLITIIPDNTKVLPRYLLYNLIHRYDEIRQLSDSNSCRGNINATILSNLNIMLPELEVQNNIVNLVSKFDDLILINNRINDYLFEVCKSLFNKIRKESNGESALSTFAEVCYGKDHKELSDGTIPVFGSGGIMRYSNKALYDGEESVLIPRKGSLNNILYVSDPFWSVDTMFYTKIKRKHGGKYLYFFLRTIDMELMNAGSAVPSMTTEILNEFMIPDPGDDVLEYFDKTIQPIFDIIKNNNKTIKTLEICRQTMIKRLFTTPTTNSSD